MKFTVTGSLESPTWPKQCPIIAKHTQPRYAVSIFVTNDGGHSDFDEGHDFKSDLDGGFEGGAAAGAVDTTRFEESHTEQGP